MIWLWRRLRYLSCTTGGGARLGTRLGTPHGWAHHCRHEGPFWGISTCRDVTSLKCAAAGAARKTRYATNGWPCLCLANAPCWCSAAAAANNCPKPLLPLLRLLLESVFRQLNSGPLARTRRHKRAHCFRGIKLGLQELWCVWVAGRATHWGQGLSSTGRVKQCRPELC
jgi:hypothetical protein